MGREGRAGTGRGADNGNDGNGVGGGCNGAEGPFELLDTIGTDKGIAKSRAEGADLPAMLQVLADSGSPTFYRAGSDGAREYLGLDGAWHAVTA